MTARDEIIARIRAATGAPPPPLPKLERAPSGLPRDAVLARFAARLADYGVLVLRLRSESEIRATAERQFAARGIASLAVPTDLPGSWRPSRPTPVDEHTLDHPALDAVQGAMTGCVLAIAETGSIVLDCGMGQGRRVLTLLPDYHLCVVRESAVVASVPEAVAALQGRAASGAPITFISGPSATADIELERVQGVHGPRTLDVILVA